MIWFYFRQRCNNTTITRQYTPISDVNLKGSFHLIIKIYTDGRMSKLIRQWRKGDWIDIRGPLGSQQYSPNKVRKHCELYVKEKQSVPIQFLRYCDYLFKDTLQFQAQHLATMFSVGQSILSRGFYTSNQNFRGFLYLQE